mmetsp:Transcript_13707/g.24584  ORF Transcript_13707/g.24584 Transcript_13707/m.24584 type:complete len:481 (-) Transcript_13707:70-1512(-)
MMKIDQLLKELKLKCIPGVWRRHRIDVVRIIDLITGFRLQLLFFPLVFCFSFFNSVPHHSTTNPIHYYTPQSHSIIHLPSSFYSNPSSSSSSSSSSSNFSHQCPPPPNQQHYPQVSIAYFIQLSASNIHLLPRLLSQIYHKHNTYVIHFDNKIPFDHINSTMAQFHSKHDDTLHLSNNIHIMPRESVTYQGVSMILNTLSAIEYSLKVNKQWKFLINLSGTDYPLISAERQRMLLALAPEDTVYASFFSKLHWNRFKYRMFRICHDPILDETLWPDTEIHKERRQETSLENNHQVLRKYVDGSLLWRKIRSPLYPFMNVHLSNSESWMIMSRHFAEFTVRSHYARRVLALFPHSVSSPEHYWAMLLYNHPFWKSKVVNNAFRHVIWTFHRVHSGQHPYILDEMNNTSEIFRFWNDIKGSLCIFTRKMSKSDNALMQRIDSTLSHSDYTQQGSFYNRLVYKFCRDTSRAFNESSAMSLFSL